MRLPFHKPLKKLVIQTNKPSMAGRGLQTAAAALPHPAFLGAGLVLAAIVLAALTLGGCASVSGGARAIHLPAAQAPAWKKGDYWVFTSRSRSPFALAERMEVASTGDETVLIGDQSPKKRAVLDKEFSVKESSGGMLSYDVISGKDAYLFFPMAVGDSRTFKQTTNTRKGAQSYTNTVTVEAAEEIAVPAGKFKTYRIVVSKKNTTGWNGVYRMWYSPDLGYFVRIQDTHGNNSELKSFGHM